MCDIWAKYQSTCVVFGKRLSDSLDQKLRSFVRQEINTRIGEGHIF